MFSGIVLGTIFIIATSFSKNGRDKSIIYLNLVVLFLTLNNLQITLVDNQYVNVNFFMHKLLIPWYVLILPFFYTFLMYYLKVEKKIYSFVSISIGLFLLEIAMRITLFPFFYNEKDCFFVARYSQIEEIINAIFSIFIFIKAFILLFNYSKLYQFVLTFDNIKWLKNFMFLGSIVLLMWVCAIILNLDKVINPVIFIYYPMRLSCSIILYWIGYQGFFNYALMTERMQLREAIEINSNAKTEFSIKPNDLSDDLFLTIKNHIESNSAYLDAEFSLEKLASETKISVNKLSHCINLNSGNNFSDFINQFRVEEAKNYLIAPEYVDYTIAAIGLECGFNSKSAFYSAFKKFTKKTPSEFKKENS